MGKCIIRTLNVINCKKKIYTAFAFSSIKNHAVPIEVDWFTKDTFSISISNIDENNRDVSFGYSQKELLEREMLMKFKAV